MAYNNRNTRRNDKKESGFGSGVIVIVKDGNIEKAIKRFKKKVQEAGIMDEIRARKAYQKPSDKKRLAKNAAKRRATKLRLAEEAEGLYGAPTKAKRKGKKN
jgi:small subunit ribosomal protein S21